MCVFLGGAVKHDPLWNLSPKSQQFRSNNKQVPITFYLRKPIYGLLFRQLMTEEAGYEACRGFSRKVGKQEGQPVPKFSAVIAALRQSQKREFQMCEK